MHVLGALAPLRHCFAEKASSPFACPQSVHFFAAGEAGGRAQRLHFRGTGSSFLHSLRGKSPWFPRRPHTEHLLSVSGAETHRMHFRGPPTFRPHCFCENAPSSPRWPQTAHRFFRGGSSVVLRGGLGPGSGALAAAQGRHLDPSWVLLSHWFVENAFRGCSRPHPMHILPAGRLVAARQAMHVDPSSALSCHWFEENAFLRWSAPHWMHFLRLGPSVPAAQGLHVIASAASLRHCAAENASRCRLTPHRAHSLLTGASAGATQAIHLDPRFAAIDHCLAENCSLGLSTPHLTHVLCSRLAFPLGGPGRIRASSLPARQSGISSASPAGWGRRSAHAFSGHSALSATAPSAACPKLGGSRGRWGASAPPSPPAVTDSGQGASTSHDSLPGRRTCLSSYRIFSRSAVTTLVSPTIASTILRGEARSSRGSPNFRNMSTDWAMRRGVAGDRDSSGGSRCGAGGGDASWIGAAWKRDRAIRRAFSHVAFW